MLSDNKLAEVLGYIVGSGKGAGMAVIFVLIGMIGFIGCCVFRASKDIRNLE